MWEKSGSVSGHPGWKTHMYGMCYSYGEKCTETSTIHLFEPRSGFAASIDAGQNFQSDTEQISVLSGTTRDEKEQDFTHGFIWTQTRCIWVITVYTQRYSTLFSLQNIKFPLKAHTDIHQCAQSTWVNLCLTTDPAFCSPLTRENNLSVDAKISVLAVGSGRHLIQPHWTKDILVYWVLILLLCSE